MKNNLSDLSNYLFDLMDALDDETVIKTQEDFERELLKADTKIKIASKILEIGKTQIEAQKLLFDNQNAELPQLIRIKDSARLLEAKK